MRASDIDSQQQPDLVAMISRDGRLLDFFGGSDLPELRPKPGSEGSDLPSVWEASVADAMLQCTRKAIAVRGASEAQFLYQGRHYELRATARGPDRASCLVRPALDASTLLPHPARGGNSRLERRGFLRRFQESMALASLVDKPAAVAALHLDAAADIANGIDIHFAEKIISLALRRLDQLELAANGDMSWYLGQLSNSLLVVVFESADREAVEQCLTRICDSMREPVVLGDTPYHLNPFCGAAILGRDASAPKMLLDCARSAAAEARRAGSQAPQFFSDTMRMRTVLRMDTARELRNAIADGSIGLRYVGRHDLASGALQTCVAYLRWMHPFRGEVPPAEFLRLAETTGQAEALSRRALAALEEDFQALSPQLDPQVRFSFGGLRHHVLSDAFVADIGALLDRGVIPADRLELRVSERACLIREPAIFRPLVERGVRLVVDEVGRDAGALKRLASAPLWGLQLDRVWAQAMRSDPAAGKLCRAFIAMTQALELVPIATAVDDAAQREAFTRLGCSLGQGDLFASMALTRTSSEHVTGVAPTKSARRNRALHRRD